MSFERRLVDKLKEIQFSSDHDEHGCGCCPECGKFSHGGHRRTCELAGLLALGGVSDVKWEA